MKSTWSQLHQSIVKYKVKMRAAWTQHELGMNSTPIWFQLVCKALWKKCVQISTKPFVVCLFELKILQSYQKNQALPPTPNHQPKPPVLSLLIPCRMVSQGLLVCCLCINMDLNREGLVPIVDGSEILHHLGCIAPSKYWDKLPTSTGAGFVPSTLPPTSMSGLVVRKTATWGEFGRLSVTGYVFCHHQQKWWFYAGVVVKQRFFGYFWHVYLETWEEDPIWRSHRILQLDWFNHHLKRLCKTTVSKNLVRTQESGSL